MKRPSLFLLPLLLAGCSEHQPTTVAVAPPSNAAVAPPPMPSGVSAAPPASTTTTNVAPPMETPTPEAPLESQAAPVATSPTDNFPVPQIVNSGFARTYANDVIKRVDASTSSSEILEIRGNLAQTSLTFQDEGQKAGLRGESELRALDERIVTLIRALSDYASNQGDFISQSISQDHYDKARHFSFITINHDVYMADSYRDANFK